MFKYVSLAWLPIFMMLGACQNEPEALQNAFEIPQEIRIKMDQQEAAWNRGDIDGFMSLAYWPNDSLIFIGSKGPTYGYQSTLDNYHRSYPDAQAMGQLDFELLEWRPLGDQHGFLIGQWTLQRVDSLGNLDGHFSLVWEQIDGQWLIVADHSS